MSAFAAVIVRNVRLNTEDFQNHPLLFYTYLARADNAEAVLKALPRLLQYDKEEVVKCVVACICKRDRYRKFAARIEHMRAQRG